MAKHTPSHSEQAAKVASRGDYVTAVSVELGLPVQGIYTQAREDGTVLVLGQTGMYRCHAPMTVVPDENLWGNAHDFVTAWRAEEACGGHDWEATGPIGLSYAEQRWRCRKCGWEEA